MNEQLQPSENTSNASQLDEAVASRINEKAAAATHMHNHTSDLLDVETQTEDTTKTPDELPPSQPTEAISSSVGVDHNAVQERQEKQQKVARAVVKSMYHQSELPDQEISDNILHEYQRLDDDEEIETLDSRAFDNVLQVRPVPEGNDDDEKSLVVEVDASTSNNKIPEEITVVKTENLVFEEEEIDLVDGDNDRTALISAAAAAAADDDGTCADVDSFPDLSLDIKFVVDTASSE